MKNLFNLTKLAFLALTLFVSVSCDDDDNGNIYSDDNGEVGDIVGKIKDGEATFFKE